MKITIRADKNYGVLTYYPACPAAEISARIAGTKTMQTLHIDGTTYRVKFDRV